MMKFLNLQFKSRWVRGISPKLVNFHLFSRIAEDDSFPKNANDAILGSRSLAFFRIVARFSDLFGQRFCHRLVTSLTTWSCRILHARPPNEHELTIGSSLDRIIIVLKANYLITSSVTKNLLKKSSAGQPTSGLVILL